MKTTWTSSQRATPTWITWACVATVLVILLRTVCTPLGAPVYGSPIAPSLPTQGAAWDEIVENDRLFAVPVVVTAYTSRPEETDDTPHITASNTWAKPGTLALSRDLLERFTPGAPFRFGDLVVIEGLGVFRVEDTMNPRAERRADIWFTDLYAARQFGVKMRVMTGPYGPVED